jgi:tryptophan synthase alpha subunit
MTTPVFSLDVFDAALDAASTTICETLGIEPGDEVKRFWQSHDGIVVKAAMMRLAAHVLIFEASRRE